MKTGALSDSIVVHRREFLLTSSAHSTSLLTVGCIWSPLPAVGVPKEEKESSTQASITNKRNHQGRNGRAITVPLKYGKQSQELLLSYKIGDGQFTAVLDTGSPFLTVPGPCNSNSSRKYGCFANEGEPSGLENTYNYYDGFEGEVEWRTGPFTFTNFVLEDFGDDRNRNDDDTTTTSPLLTGGGDSQKTIFGAVSESIMKGPGGVFFGLIKRSDDRIRPSFLSQVSVQSFRINLCQRETPTLTLSDKAVIGVDEDCIPLTNDLRQKYGDPVGHYTAKVDQILVNGNVLELPDNKPIYAIVDTGCTGMVVSTEIFREAYALRRLNKTANMWGSVEISFKTKGGRIVALNAEKPITTFFDPESVWKKRFRINGGTPHVIVVGLALLDGTEITIDVDDERMRIETM